MVRSSHNCHFMVFNHNHRRCYRMGANQTPLVNDLERNVFGLPALVNTNLCFNIHLSIYWSIISLASTKIKKTTSKLKWFSGGEKGIRTLDTLRYTRFPGARVRPDYATSPYDPSGRDRNFTINKLDREGKVIVSGQFFLLQYPPK